MIRNIVLLYVGMVLVGWVCPAATVAEPATHPADAVGASATGQVIEGMVLNHDGGGIEGARVRIEARGAAKDAPALAEMTTKGLGEIHLQLPRPATEPVRVRIVKEGYAEFVEEIDPTDKDNPPFIDATLEGTGKLTGTVTDHLTGKPISGVNVECGNGGRVRPAVTDADGKFAFDGMVMGQAQLTYMAEGYGTQRERLEIGEYRVNINRTLHRQRSIELMIEDSEGKPAAGVMVEAMVEPDFDYITATSDSAGKARLNGVNAGAVAVHLRMNGERYVRTTEYVKKIDLGEATSEPASEPAPVTRKFTLRIGGGVKGKVIDTKTHEPIVGVRVIAGREVSSVMPMTWTEDDGAFQLTGLEPGFNVISFQHGDYATGIREVRVVSGKPTDLNMELAAGLPIEGVVVDAKGQPLDQVRVSAESWKGFRTLGLRTITGVDGKFAIPNAPEGEIAFSFVRPGYGVLTDQVLAAGKRDCRITLEEMKQEAAAEQGGGRPQKIKVGEVVPDLTLTATDGKVYKLAELRGKYVFIDCWASWCGPCVGEIPNVKALREATKGRTNFVLIGVSLDTDSSAFKTAVSKHGIDWPQAFGPKSGAQEAFDAFDGFGIPYMCLIGPDGKLIAQHLRGPGLVKEVEKFLAAPREIVPPGDEPGPKSVPQEDNGVPAPTKKKVQPVPVIPGEK